MLDITNVVTALIALAGGAPLGVLLNNRLAERKDGREADKDAVDLVALWRKEAAAAVTDLASMRSEAGKLREEIAILRQDRDADRILINELRNSEDDLINWVDYLHTGIENGTIPPLGKVPGRIQTILGRLLLRANHDHDQKPK